MSRNKIPIDYRDVAASQGQDRDILRPAEVVCASFVDAIDPATQEAVASQQAGYVARPPPDDGDRYRRPQGRGPWCQQASDDQRTDSREADRAYLRDAALRLVAEFQARGSDLGTSMSVWKAALWREGIVVVERPCGSALRTSMEESWGASLERYYCRHCEAEVYDRELQQHLVGQRHRDFAAMETEGAGAVAVSQPPVPMASCPSELTSGRAVHTAVAAPLPPDGLEVWKAWDAAAGCARCLACSKVCDGQHEQSKEHRRKLEQYLWFISEKEYSYSSPPQAWLAWVPDESFGRHRYLRCLLCCKWVDDNADEDTAEYSGTHGFPSDQNQKGHRKRLQYMDFDVDALLEEKRHWHPDMNVAGAYLSLGLLGEPRP
mmetsp:Transcript_96047/g.277363  ORF Transcript_96047/g.277363 Transcript_96047/m.277363 type:complete len:376 (+) Transcript_96047:70-1197(+)